MLPVIEDRVQETSTSSGTGDMIVAGAVLAHRTFSSVCSVGAPFYGMIVATDANSAPTGEWEAGYYTYSAVNTITRTTVTANHLSSTAKVAFSQGIKHIFIDVTAALVKTFTNNGTSGNAAMPYGLSPSLFTGMIFQEEFNGSALDPAKWKKALTGLPDDPLQNFSVANGNLNVWPDTGFVDRYITTDGNFYFTPGCFIEFEGKMPVGKGVNANVWLTINDTAVHPGIDMAKTFTGGAPQNPGSIAPGYADASWHPINFRLLASDNTAGGATTTIRASDFITVPDLSLSLHKYGVKWEKDGITFYYDGVQVGPKVATANINQRMFITASVSFGSGADAPDTTNTPRGVSNAFVVNYIRGWQLV